MSNARPAVVQDGPDVMVALRVQPRASRNQLVVADADSRLSGPRSITIRVTAPPVAGAANAACCIFLVQVRNQTSEEVQFDPALTFLVDQGGWRGLPLSYDEMYLGMSEGERSGPAMQSLQATLFSRFVVVSPGGQREGLLVFSVVGPEAKLLRLEFTSFFIGGKSAPGLFEFQVIRQKTE